jgi:hypothetical protein
MRGSSTVGGDRCRYQRSISLTQTFPTEWFDTPAGRFAQPNALGWINDQSGQCFLQTLDVSLIDQDARVSVEDDLGDTADP